MLNALKWIKARSWPFAYIEALERYGETYKNNYFTMRAIGDNLARKCSEQAAKIRELEAQIAELKAIAQAEKIKSGLATSNDERH